MPEADERAADIARVAALRGRQAADYTPVAMAQRFPVEITDDMVNGLWRHAGNMAVEMEFFDDLPPASREVLAGFFHAIAPSKWRALLEHVRGDEAWALRFLRRCEAAMIESLARRDYGPHHPQAKGER